MAKRTTKMAPTNKRNRGTGIDVITPNRSRNSRLLMVPKTMTDYEEMKTHAHITLSYNLTQVMMKELTQLQSWTSRILGDEHEEDIEEIQSKLNNIQKSIQKAKETEEQR